MKLNIVAGVEEVVDNRIHLLPNLAVAVAEGFEALENAIDVEAAQAGGEEVVDGRLHLLPNLAFFWFWPTAPSSRASLRRCFGWEGPRCSPRDLPVRMEKDVFVLSAEDLFPFPE